MIIVPAQFAARRIQVAGELGAQWVSELPVAVEDLCRRWQLTIDGDPLAGEVGLALPVRRENDPLMLKVSFPDADSAFEAWALDVWNGRGAARLIDHDGQWALLLERLDSGRSLRSIPVDEAVRVGAQLLRRLAVRSPVGPPSQSETVNHIRGEFLAEKHVKRFAIPIDVIDLALDCVMPDNAAELVLVNTDLHYDNVLAGAREPWLVIDPKVIIGHVEFGIAPLIWNLRNEFFHTSPARFLENVVAAGDFDADLARRLTLIRTVDYWMWAIETGLKDDPEMCRAIIEALA